MRPRFFASLLGLLLGLGAVGLVAQGSLSDQVLRLLTRDNEWTGVNTYDHEVGLVLERGSAPTATTDTLYNVGGNLYFNGTLIQAAVPGGGTVSSVGLSAPSLFTVNNTPITSSGTLALVFNQQTANRVLAGPTSGPQDVPTMRSLVAADIPDISATYLTPTSTAALTNKTGNISQWTNDSGYLTTVGTGGAGITTVGTVTAGTWNATLIAGQYGGTGVANTGKTITLGGNFTTSGANAVTLTTTGATNVTLPTSGTLVATTTTSLASLATVGTITAGVWNGTAIGVAFGGTNLASYAVGDIIYASGATTLSKLADVATGNALISGGVTTAPSWGKIGLTTHVSGTLPVANGGTGITTVAANGQIPVGNGTGYTAATITGTANQVTVTNGAGTITLSLPQAIATGSNPQHNRLGLGTGAGSVARLTLAGVIDGGFIDDGNCGASDTIDWSAGSIHKSTLTAATCTYTFSNPIAGVTYELLVIQDGTGGRLVTWPGAVTWRAGAAPTLTATINKTDICFFRYNGSVYYGDCSLNY